MSNIVPISRHIPAQPVAAQVSSRPTSAQMPVGDRRKARQEGAPKRRCGDHATMEFAAQVIAQQTAGQLNAGAGELLVQSYQNTDIEATTVAPVRLLASA